VQAALLFQSAPAAVFSAFCDSRLAGWMPNAPLSGAWGPAFGTLGAQTDFDTIIARAMPR
jgi:putative acyl-CoA dehydrogenase